LYKGPLKQGTELARFDMPVIRDGFLAGGGAGQFEREAYKTAFASGEKAGYDAGIQKAQAMLDKIEGLLRDLTTLKSTIVREAELQCVELAMSIARKIIITELTARPEELVQMTKEGLLRLERTGQVTIKVHPALYDFFNNHKPDLLKIHPDIVFDADPSVTRYGTVVMGPVEDVVTDVDEQLKNLIKDMVDRHGAD